MRVSSRRCFGARLVVSFFVSACYTVLGSAWRLTPGCYRAQSYTCTFFYFLFLLITFPIYALLILNIFLNFIRLLCLYNLLLPWYNNFSLIFSHFVRDVLVSISSLMDSMNPCSCLNVEGDFRFSISVPLRLNFQTSSANQVSCCRYAPELCCFVAERDCRHDNYWVSSNGRLTLYDEWRGTGFASVLCRLFNEVCQLNYLRSAEQ
jgi:hypothetical protein